MKIKLLNRGYYQNEELYEDFLNDTVEFGKDYFSDEIVHIKKVPDFPIYMGAGSRDKRRQDFFDAFQTMDEHFVNIDRELTFEGRFWHSLLITQKRDYILHHYPQVRNSFNQFRNIVTKPFDWENYIYKCLIGAQYIHDHTTDEAKKHHYYEMIIDNLDLYNYIIKHEISRNGKLLLNVLDIIHELDLSELLKAKIKGREDLGDDERYGRRVMFEFNKSYPVIMAPMLEKDQLKEVFIEFLSYYDDVSEIKARIHRTPIIEEEHKKPISVTAASEQNDGLEQMTIEKYEQEEKSKLANSSVAAERNNLPTIAKHGQPEDSEDVFDVIDYLTEHGIHYIDLRDQDEYLWVLGDRSIAVELNLLRMRGINFRYRPTGSPHTNYRPAWFWQG